MFVVVRVTAMKTTARIDSARVALRAIEVSFQRFNIRIPSSWIEVSVPHRADSFPP